MEELFKTLEKFYPECHDAGKLIYTYSEGQDKHWEFLGKVKTEWQRTIFQHHFFKLLKEYEQKKIDFNRLLPYWPRELEIILTILADHFAASYSREGLESDKIREAPNYKFNKLWHKDSWDFENFRESSENSFMRLYYTINKNYKEVEENLKKYFDSEPSDFLEIYKELLLLRAEDAHPARNIISLYTHLDLTKKAYFLLEEIIKEDQSLINLFNDLKKKIEDFYYKLYKLNIAYSKEQLKDIDFNIKNNIKNIKNIFEEIKNRLSGFIIEIEFIFPQFFYKAHDLYIFKELKDKINEILSNKGYERYLFSIFDFNMLFIVPPSKENILIEEFKNFTKECPIYLHIKKTDSPRKIYTEILKNPSYYLRNEKVIHPADLLDEIKVLCEVCRIYNGLRVEDDEKVFYLCEKCKKLREKSKDENPFYKYGNWEEGEVCFLYFNIDKSKFKEWLQEIYNYYLKEQNFSITMSIENELVFRWEFDKDIKEALKNFEEITLKENYGEDNFEKITDQIYLIRLKRDKNDRFLIFKDIYNFIKNNFSSFYIKTESQKPLRIIISFNKVKYPFFLNWRNVEEFKHNKEDLIFILPNNEKLSLSYIQLKSFIEYINKIEKEEPIFIKSKLYQLKEIAKISKELAKIEFSSLKENDSSNFYKISEELIESIDFNTFLNLIETAINYFDWK